MDKKLVLIPLVFLIFIIPNIAAGEESKSEPVKYNTAIMLENIGTIDRQSGSYELIFWVTMTSDEIDFTKNPPPESFDFTNGYVEEVSGVHIEPHFYKFKVRGVFFNSFDFKNYPFEKIELAVFMEPYYPNTSDKLVFTVNPAYAGIGDSKTISVPGWNLGTATFDTTVEKYPWGDFSHFGAHYPVETTAFSAFMKKLFPIAILMGFAFASFALSPEKIGERLGMVSASLLSAIFFHTGFLLAELPPLGYLTIADKIMIVAYALFIICLLPIVITKYYSEFRKQQLTLTEQLQIDKKIVISAPIILPVIFFIVYFGMP